jgi:hypothetical protein
MDTQTPQSRTRSVLGATCLALGIVLFAATDLINPYAGSPDDQVGAVRNDPAGVGAYALTWLVASFLLVAGAATAVGRIRERGAGLALAGGSLAGAGAIAGAAIAGLESVPISLASALPDDATLDAALTSFDSSALLGLLFLTLLVGTAFGWPLLIGGAARARLMSRWFVLAAAAGVVAIVTSQASTSLVVDLMASAVLVVPILALAWVIVRGERPAPTPAASTPTVEVNRIS